MSTPATAKVPTRVFLSCVSSEFRSYRLKLANQLGALKGQPYLVKVQEDFDQGGYTLLEKLGDYVRGCDLVIHLVGDGCGARPTAEHVRAMFARLGVSAPEPLPDCSYTQWEYRLAIRFDRRMLCYFAKEEAPRDPRPRVDGVGVEQSEGEAQLQREHRLRIERSGKHYSMFSSHADLVRHVFDDLGLQPELKINNLPYKSLGSLFKGRDDFLAQLHKTLGEAEYHGHNRIAAITAAATAATVHGLGGIGKTRAALEYAHRYADEYTAMLFVQADSPAGLRQNLAALCGPMVLDLSEKDAKETEVQVAAVVEWLQRHPGWFLILDNVDTEEAATAVQGLLARLSRAGQVVITSRLSNWEGAVETLALDVLTVDAAAEFLLERTEGGSDNQGGRRERVDDAAQARVLAVELGQLALALEQAGAYIVRYKYTLDGYLNEWRTNHDRVLTWFNERTMQYPRSVAVTWQTSFERLSDPARQLLRLLSWLAPDPIPESLLEAGGGPFAVPHFPLFQRWKVILPSYRAVRNANCGETLAELSDHSLVKRSDEEPTFSVHRLVQDVGRRTLPEKEKMRYLRQALRWVNDAFEGDPINVRNWAVLDPLVPHALAVSAFADGQQLSGPTAGLMNQVGGLYVGKEQYGAAEPLFRRALAIDERHKGSSHEDVAERLNNLGLSLIELNRLAEAEPLLRRSLAIEEEIHGFDHPRVATKLHNLVLLLREANRLNEAEPIIRRALAIKERANGQDDPGVALVLANLGKLLTETNRHIEAEALFRRALAIDEKYYGPDHPAVSNKLGHLAILLKSTDRGNEAEPLIRRALDICERTLPQDHPYIYQNMELLAGMLEATGRFEEAEPLRQRVIEGRECKLGSEHPDTLRSWNNYSTSLREHGLFERAEGIDRRMIAATTKVLGETHLLTINRRNNLVLTLILLGKLDEARALLHENWQVKAESFANTTPRIAFLAFVVALLEARPGTPVSRPVEDAAQWAGTSRYARHYRPLGHCLLHRASQPAASLWQC
jgi:tetratricopeptide (TPR) repeat protein